MRVKGTHHAKQCLLMYASLAFIDFIHGKDSRTNGTVSSGAENERGLPPLLIG